MCSSTEVRIDMVVVLMTAPDEAVASAVGRTLVEEKLAACVNIVPTVHSIYVWEGKTCDEREVLCLIKTRRSLCARLAERIRALHPYQVPEIVALDAGHVNESYLAWVHASTLSETTP